MEKLSPIQVPRRVRLREFNARFVPLIVFGSAVAVMSVLLKQASGGSMAGIAEGSNALVTSSRSGRVMQLHVRPFEYVTAGQPVALLHPTDPEIEFDLLQAEVALQRIRAAPSIPQENAMNFERLRVELLRMKSELEVAVVEKRRAEREFELNRKLHDEGLISDDLLDVVAASRDALAVEVESKGQAVGLIEQRLAALEKLGVPDFNPQTSETDPFGNLEQIARSQRDPFTLHAPDTGLVQFVYRQEGENVEPGEPIIHISPLRAERIISYLRQPYPVELAVGTPVEITTRDRRKRMFQSHVSRIGTRLEPVTNALARVTANLVVDTALPFVVDLPSEVDIRPGEIVDIRLLEDRASQDVRNDPSATLMLGLLIDR